MVAKRDVNVVGLVEGVFSQIVVEITLSIEMLPDEGVD